MCVSAYVLVCETCHFTALRETQWNKKLRGSRHTDRQTGWQTLVYVSPDLVWACCKRNIQEELK